MQKPTKPTVLFQTRAVPYVRSDGRRVLKYELTTNNKGKLETKSFKYKYKLIWAINNLINDMKFGV